MRSDAELIVASQTDPRAFRELYDRWAVTLAGYFYRRVNDAEVAADLVAETFAVAYECRGRFRDVGTPGGGWLYGIARHQLQHYFHRRRVELQAVQRLGIQIPEIDRESVAAIEALETAGGDHAGLTDAMERLSANERDAVQLRVVAELDYGEIAARLRCSEAAARTRVHRGLAHLSELMEAP